MQKKKPESLDMNTLESIKVAVLVSDGFEQSEMVEPVKALKNAGAQVDIISPTKTVKGWQNNNWADEFPVDISLNDAQAELYNALMLPGGVINADHLRALPKAIEFVRKFGIAGKPIAAICHGPWMLVNALIIYERTVTSWPAIKLDLVNAGAQWLDREVVCDKNFITSRKPEDIPAFNREMIRIFGIQNKPLL